MVKFNSPNTLFDIDFAQSRSSQASALEALLDLSTPKAYYMCTSLAPLMRGEN